MLTRDKLTDTPLGQADQAVDSAVIKDNRRPAFDYPVTECLLDDLVDSNICQELAVVMKRTYMMPTKKEAQWTAYQIVSCSTY